MYIPFLSRKNSYRISKRTYLEDYSNSPGRKIDMRLSGKFLPKRKIVNFKSDYYSSYPSLSDTKKLISYIKEKEETNLEIIIGAGANGVLQNIVKILFSKKGNLVTPFYSFDQVEFAVTSMSGYTKRVYTNNYEIDFKKMKRLVDHKTRMVYICNPNNPTGIYVNNETLINFAKSVNTFVVIDESCIEFTQKESLLKRKDLPENIIVVRTFSKAYGLANLRIGYLACSTSFLKKYYQNTTTNEYSGVSVLLALKMMKKNKSVIKNVNLVIKERERIIKSLNDIGVRCINGNSNIIMTKTTFSDKALQYLVNHNIAVVPVYDENNKIHIRIAVQEKKVNDKFIKLINKMPI